MLGDRVQDDLSIDFQSLSVRVQGKAPSGVARLLQSDWRRQTTKWSTTHGLSVSVLSGGDRPAGPEFLAGRRATALTHNGPLEFWAEGEVFSAPGLTLETSEHHSLIALNKHISAAALLLAFTEVQRAAGLLPLHASVLHRDGQTLAVSGPSGAGKSTAALRLLGRGWHLMAEDWAWFSPATLEVIGWDSGLRLRTESLEHFAPELLRDASTDAHGKKVLSPPRLLGPQRLSGVCFLSAVPHVSRLEFVRAVWNMVGAPLTPAARQTTQAGVNRLLMGVPMEHTDRDALVVRLS